MPKANLEYFPHLFDLIFHHISPWDLHIASQVCSSWRSRAEVRYLRHVSVEPMSEDTSSEGWELSIPASFFFHLELKYYHPSTAPPSHPPMIRDEDRDIYTDHLRKLAPDMLKHVHVLDISFQDLREGEEEAYRRFLAGFDNLQVLRAQVRCNFPIRGKGHTQFFFCLWEDGLYTRLATGDVGNVGTLVLNFGGRTYDEILSRGNPIQACLFEQSVEMEGVREVVFVIDSDMAKGGGAGGVSGLGLAGGGCHADPRRVARGPAGAMRKFSKFSNTTVTLVGYESGEAYARFNTALTRGLSLDASDKDSRERKEGRVLLLSHAQYEARVGKQVYDLHCVWEMEMWKPYTRDGVKLSEEQTRMILAKKHRQN